MNIASIFIPLVVLTIIIFGSIKKIDIIESFKKGVKEGSTTAFNIFPTILAMMLAVNIFTKSHFLTDVFTYIKSILNISNFPLEVMPLAFLKPLSGTTSLVILNDLLTLYPPDTYKGYLSSVLAGSTDTTIYILSCYYSSINIKNTNHSLTVGLLTDMITIIIAIITSYFLFNM